MRFSTSKTLRFVLSNLSETFNLLLIISFWFRRTFLEICYEAIAYYFASKVGVSERSVHQTIELVNHFQENLLLTLMEAGECFAAPDLSFLKKDRLPQVLIFGGDLVRPKGSPWSIFVDLRGSVLRTIPCCKSHLLTWGTLSFSTKIEMGCEALSFFRIH